MSQTNGTSSSSSSSSSTDRLPLLKNVLSQSRSPYVRGHMNNPVAWQMWSPEALELARKQNKLIFLSIGYAACHWCHVMERESFESQKVADVLNKHFIPIKVDREERPDVDRIYMNYVQATSGHGGWPLNVFITPDLKPVFGGTYFPGPNSPMAAGHMTFLSLLERIRTVWQTQRQKCIDTAEDVTAQLKEFALDGNHGGPRTSEDGEDGLDLDLLEEAYQHFADKFDTTHAGFGGAPKFPTPSNLAFLLSLGQYSGAVKHVVGLEECETAKSMVLSTLRNMTRGGIHDQVGHGFARYSVTRDWSLPHFEKMLYDQGQLLNVYLDAFLITGDAEMLGAVYDIVTYLTTPPLAAPRGGFFSSEDADSYYRKGDKEKREGAFYVFTKEEFRNVLGDDAEICAKFFNVKEKGNVSAEHDAHNELTDQNVLATSSAPGALAKEFNRPKDEVKKLLKEARKKLRRYRDQERPRPDLDDKIVVAWNGLAVGALARTMAVLSSIDKEKAEVCRDAAVRAVDFVKRNLFDETTGTMRRVYREGPGDAPAFADDYAMFIQGLLELYEATFDDQYLEFADTLQKTQIRLFHDTTRGGFYSTHSSQPDMIMRLKDGMDNAEPGTNGISASNLHRLSSYLSDASYSSLARKTVAAFATEVMQHPFLFASMLGSVVAGRCGVRGIVVSGEGDEVDAAVSKLRLRVKVNSTVVRLGGGARSAWLEGRNGLLAECDKMRSALQVCEGGACREVLDLAMVEKALAGEVEGEGEVGE